MKINEDFIYILRYWPKYSMLPNVTATMDTPDLSQFYSPKFRCEVPAASSPDSAFLSLLLIPAFSVKKTSSLRQATNLPFVLVPLKFPLVSESQPRNFNCKNSVNNERF